MSGEIAVVISISQNGNVILIGIAAQQMVVAKMLWVWAPDLPT